MDGAYDNVKCGSGPNQLIDVYSPLPVDYSQIGFAFFVVVLCVIVVSYRTQFNSTHCLIHSNEVQVQNLIDRFICKFLHYSPTS